MKKTGIYTLLLQLLCILTIGICPSTTFSQTTLVYLADKPTESEEKQLAAAADYITAYYKNIGYSIRAKSLNVRMFNQLSNFKVYQSSSGNSTSDSGYYSPKNKEIVILKSSRFDKIFSHEFNHFAIHSILSRHPRWLTEGLSEYFELYDPSTNTVLRQSQKIERIKRWIPSHLSNSIDLVIDLPGKDWKWQNSHPEFRASTAAYSIICFIMSRPDSDQIISALLRATDKGSSPKEALNSSYPGGYEKMKQELSSYYERL